MKYLPDGELVKENHTSWINCPLLMLNSLLIHLNQMQTSVQLLLPTEFVGLQILCFKVLNKARELQLLFVPK